MSKELFLWDVVLSFQHLKKIISEGEKYFLGKYFHIFKVLVMYRMSAQYIKFHILKCYFEFVNLCTQPSLEAVKLELLFIITIKS